ncbi:MAG: M48 family metallopeptidase [Candidatus Omnitrophica bacterium]|nr:M48 family metallopeptidase [Candidatus Omnitrophota bacterium]
MVSFLIIAGGCATTFNPATGRNEMIFIGSQSEVAIGRDMDAEIQKEMPMLKDEHLLRRLDIIGQRVAAYSDRKDIPYHFAIVKDDSLNAFAIPGGYIYVHEGLIRAATDNELAGVLAHEIGHVAAKHSVKQLQSVMGFQLFAGLAAGLTGEQAAGNAMNLVFNIVNKGYSRRDESFADYLAVKYSHLAGYDPYGLVTFFEKLKAEQEKHGPALRVEFLSSHPDLSARIIAVKEHIGRLSAGVVP